MGLLQIERLRGGDEEVSERGRVFVYTAVVLLAEDTQSVTLHSSSSTYLYIF